MKTPISTSLLPILAAATLLTLTACSDYDNGYTEQQLNFIRDFKNIYGDIDPTQDWNLAERASVTVTTTSPSNIKIYARYDSRYTLVANYTNVSGTQTLGFDIIEGTNEVLVSDGQMAYKAKVGESVEFGKGTRTINAGTFKQPAWQNEEIKISLIDGKEADENGVPGIWMLDENEEKKFFPEYKNITQSDYDVFLRELPEIGGGNRTTTNIDKVENNFHYTSTGKFIIYPYYFVTTEKDEIGLYYFDDNGNKVEVPIYTMAGELEYLPKTRPVEGQEEDIWISVPGNSHQMFVNETKAKAVRSHGIIVDIPVGKVFGMYLKQYDRKNGSSPQIDSKYEYNSTLNVINAGKEDYVPYAPYDKEGKDSDGNTVYDSNSRYTLYSESKRNNDLGKHGQGVEYKPETGLWEKKENLLPCYAATFEANGQMFLAFEDWSNRWNQSDFDFNDVVFAFDGATPIIIPEDEVQSWIISAEDLGNTYDIDYNDVVLEVQYISGQTQANIIPLAAGGTLPVHIYFGDATTEPIGEIHQLLGGTPKSTGLYTPINVSGPTPKTKYKSATRQNTAQTTYTDDGILITVPENFSLASSLVGKDYHTATAPNMGGFRIEVTYTDGNKSKTQTIQNTPTEGTNNVPYVICTPKTYKDDQKQERHYRWPQESRPMFPTGTFTDADAAYNNAPDGQKFIDWVRNKKNATEWYKYPNHNATCAPQ